MVDVGCDEPANAPSLFLEFSSVGDVALADEPAGLQHSSLHSALILLSSIFVNHFFGTIIDSA